MVLLLVLLMLSAIRMHLGVRDQAHLCRNNQQQPSTSEPGCKW
jgi:hypothetical protein